ncbi:nucleotidyltransferase family protein [Gloeocapsopsis dulcis]|uniref:Nucleotidyltransferase n=1 Tax=Gloeocapsopsis dulcis AAB1 = 1H9 TaxID=1433147 RepID=A0A6N8FUX4_9CHRO|nr:nucleotidyltransferase family protein [Gloeocapsopsis dulcis]MUL36918.1 nucleotidyltransferase [Gloeocapsopsis dulcis AAB1 = 1H9]WNN88732.1 nucleotidyltransferase family protein [Gloeocapsopsis dulcis]
MKTLTEIKSILSQYKPVLQKQYKVSKIGIFGLYVRGEQNENSDVNVLVDFDTNFRFGLLTFCELKSYLSEKIGLKVDLVMKDRLKPKIGQQILR